MSCGIRCSREEMLLSAAEGHTSGKELQKKETIITAYYKRHE